MRKIQTILVLASICFTVNSFAISEKLTQKIQTAQELENLVQSIKFGSIGTRQHTVYTFTSLFCMGEVKRLVKHALARNPSPDSEMNLRDILIDIQTAYDVAKARSIALEGSIENTKLVKQIAEEKIRELEGQSQTAERDLKIGLLKQQIQELPKLWLAAAPEVRSKIDELARSCNSELTGERR